MVSEDLFINSANFLPTSNLMKASCSLIAVSPSVAADVAEEEVEDDEDEEEDDLPRNTTQIKDLSLPCPSTVMRKVPKSLKTTGVNFFRCTSDLVISAIHLAASFRILVSSDCVRDKKKSANSCLSNNFGSFVADISLKIDVVLSDEQFGLTVVAFNFSIKSSISPVDSRAMAKKKKKKKMQ
uniref:Uncharacterized protein n=1 Tax=Glossina austeni TaxID=7395 RepID=A0A1A9VNA4_GLOAU